MLAISSSPCPGTLRPTPFARCSRATRPRNQPAIVACDPVWDAVPIWRHRRFTLRTSSRWSTSWRSFRRACASAARRYAADGRVGERPGPTTASSAPPCAAREEYSHLGMDRARGWQCALHLPGRRGFCKHAYALGCVVLADARSEQRFDDARLRRLLPDAAPTPAGRARRVAGARPRQPTSCSACARRAPSGSGRARSTGCWSARRCSASVPMRRRCSTSCASRMPICAAGDWPRRSPALADGWVPAAAAAVSQARADLAARFAGSRARRAGCRAARVGERALRRRAPPPARGVRDRSGAPTR